MPASPKTSTTRARGERRAGGLVSMLFGYFPGQVVHVAARLRLADHLADGAMPAAELASAAACDPDSLRRLLRALVALGGGSGILLAAILANCRTVVSQEACLLVVETVASIIEVAPSL